MREPFLRPEDVRLWDGWAKSFRAWGRTQSHARRVDSARRVLDEELERSAAPQVSWSAGKDSTALTHLVVVDRGARHVPVVSEKDDLDFPGEEAYVTTLAEQWGAELEILRPPSSPLEFVREAFASGKMVIGQEIHARTAELSKRFFYNVMAAANRGRDLILMGLRAEESDARNKLRTIRGRAYTLKTGERRCIPIADWRGIDVYAYLDRAGIDVLPVYRCIALLHRDAPWMVRKSWWLPGAGGRQVIWLRYYWPDLYRRLCALTRDAKALA